MKIKNVIKAIYTGDFGWKSKDWVFNHLCSFLLCNIDLIDIANKERYFRHLKNEFCEIIDKADYSNLERKKSNKVWFCWLQGYDNAPDLVKACFMSAQKNMPKKEIIFLDETNIFDYINLPDYIIEKYNKGIISKTHFSDVIRISLLSKYGGLWIDSTVLCTDPNFPAYITELPLFVYKLMDLSNQKNRNIVASNWLLSAEINNPIILLTRDLLYAYWKKYDRLVDYFIFHFFFTMATIKFKEEWKRIPVFNNHSPHVLQFELAEAYDEQRWAQIMNMSSFHKLNNHNNYTGYKNSNYQHIIDLYNK